MPTPENKAREVIAEALEKAGWRVQDYKSANLPAGRGQTEADEEGIRLNHLAAEFDRATLRGETPDPSNVAQVPTAQAALVKRLENLNPRMQTMTPKAEGAARTAEGYYPACPGARSSALPPGSVSRSPFRVMLQEQMMCVS